MKLREHHFHKEAGFIALVNYQVLLGKRKRENSSIDIRLFGVLFKPYKTPYNFSISQSHCICYTHFVTSCTYLNLKLKSNIQEASETRLTFLLKCFTAFDGLIWLNKTRLSRLFLRFWLLPKNSQTKIKCSSFVENTNYVKSYNNLPTKDKPFLCFGNINLKYNNAYQVYR